jgi:hypothetical protein
MDLTLSQLALILGVAPTRLTESPTNRIIQRSANKLLTMLNELALHLQEKRYALYWLRTPQRELGGLTALDWLMNGRLEEIDDYVGRMVAFQPD